MYTTTFNEIDLYPIHKQVEMLEAQPIEKQTRSALNRLTACLNRDYTRNAIKTTEYIRLGLRVKSLYRAH